MTELLVTPAVSFDLNSTCVFKPRSSKIFHLNPLFRPTHEVSTMPDPLAKLKPPLTNILFPKNGYWARRFVVRKFWLPLVPGPVLNSLSLEVILTVVSNGELSCWRRAGQSSRLVGLGFRAQ